MRLRTTLAALTAALVTPALAAAQQITFVHEGSGSGAVAGAPFATSNFVITATADLVNLQSLGFGGFVDHTSAEIDIAGVGVYQFTVPTRTFVNNTAQVVGFSRAGSGGGDLMNGPVNAAFATWDMLTGIPPTTGPGSLLQWSGAESSSTRASSR